MCFVVGSATFEVLLQKLRVEGSHGDTEIGLRKRPIHPDHSANGCTRDRDRLGDEMLIMARARLDRQQNVGFEKTDAEEPSYANGQFDTVFMANVIAALNVPKTLRACFRELKPDGRLLITNLTFRMPPLACLALDIRSLLALGIPPHGRRDPLPARIGAVVHGRRFPR